MQIFEFQFNPKKKDNLIISSLNEPAKNPEKTMGNLYIAGELKNTLSGGDKFLNKLIKIIGQEYYSQDSSVEESIKRSLQKANDFLTEENTIGNSRWIGNLHLVILAQQKNKISIAKTGNIKVYLIKYKKINELDGINSDKNKETSPFEKIITIKINDGNKIIIATKDIFDLFNKKKVVSEISKFYFLDKKIVDGLIDPIKNDASLLSGIFLLFDKNRSLKEDLKTDKEINFSFNELIFFIKNFLLKKEKIKILRDKINLKDNRKRAIFLIILLIIVLMISSIILQKKENTRNKEIEYRIQNIIKKNIDESQKLQNANKRNEAFILLKETWNNLTNLDHPKTKILKIEVEEHLKSLSHLTIIENPELILEFTLREFVPQKIIYFKNKIYLFSPFSNKIIRIDLSNQERKEFFLEMNENQGINSSAIVNNELVFFSKPNDLFILRNNSINYLGSLQKTKNDVDLISFSSFGSNLYFINDTTKEIIKYRGIDSLPQLWLSQYTKKPTDIRSISVDGHVWTLNRDNTVWRYSAGSLNKKININIFPFSKNISQIYTFANLNYIYLLEPSNNRIIIMDKNGNVIQQFQSEKFNNLIHFTVSSNGRIIYLLNSLKVYKIKLF